MKEKKNKHKKNFPRFIKEGIGCCDTDSFYYDLTEFISMCLKQFLKDHKRFPSHPLDFKSNKEWRNYLKEIIKDLDKMNSLSSSVRIEARKGEIVQKALERLIKVWTSLWL